MVHRGKLDLRDYWCIMLGFTPTTINSTLNKLIVEITFVILIIPTLNFMLYSTSWLQHNPPPLPQGPTLLQAHLMPSGDPRTCPVQTKA